MRAHYFGIIVVFGFLFISPQYYPNLLMPQHTNVMYIYIFIHMILLSSFRALAAHVATIFEARSLQVCNKKIKTKITKTI